MTQKQKQLTKATAELTIQEVERKKPLVRWKEEILENGWECNPKIKDKHKSYSLPKGK